MYIPAAFRVSEREKLTAFLRENSFALLITSVEGVPFATHLPLLYDESGGDWGTLRGHVARANPQWEHFATGQEVLAVFSGPHAYISPAWYTTMPAVPTWNYTAVHAYGVPRIITEDTAIIALFAEMISFYEAGQPAPWSGELPNDFAAKMRRGIVAFEIPLTRLEGKFKMSQNRPEADRVGVIQALQNGTDPLGPAVAEIMLKTDG